MSSAFNTRYLWLLPEADQVKVDQRASELPARNLNHLDLHS